MKEIKRHIKNKTKVYSLEYGAGEITGILKLYDGIEDYVEVRFYDADHDVRCFPNKFHYDLRVSSNPIELTSILKDLHEKMTHTDYTKVGDSYQRIGVDMDLDLLIGIISSLVGRDNLNLQDKLLLERCLSSLTLEVEHVYQISEVSARGLISDYLNVA